MRSEFSNQNARTADDNETRAETLAASVMRLARSTLIVNLRFLDAAAHALPCKSGGTGFGTDGRQIAYDAVSVLRLYKSERTLPARTMLHSLFHCVFLHFFFDAARIRRRYWDLACDIAVEASILDLKLSCVKTESDEEMRKQLRRIKRQTKHLTAEVLYRYFCDQEEKENPFFSKEELARLEQLFGRDDHGGWVQSPTEKTSEQTRAGDGHWHKMPSNERNEAADKEAEEPETHARTEPESHLQMTEKKRPVSPEFEGLQELWKDIAEHVKTDIETFSRMRGSGAGNLRQNLSAVTRESYDYADFLKKFAAMDETMRINDDEFDYIFYTYGLRLYENIPLVEPLEYKESRQIRDFVIAIDTSGSTSGKLVQNFIQKTYNILMQQEFFALRMNLYLVQCDAKIQESVCITSEEQFEDYLRTMQIRGLGGTDFRPVFAYVDELVEKKVFTNLRGLIYFTDGRGRFPDKPPAYKTAVVYLEDGYDEPAVPVWAIRLMLRKDQIETPV